MGARWPRIGRAVRRVQRVEGFVRAIVAGGLCLVVGLWMLSLSTGGPLAWVGGLGLVLLGLTGLTWGILTPLTG